jgi:hypothetical protein
VRGIVHTGTAVAPRAWRVLGDETGGAGPRLQARPLPFAAEDFAEIDETRAVLVRGSEAVLMRDANHVAPVRGDGALTPRPWRHATRCGERVRCEGLRCVIDGIWPISVPAPSGSVGAMSDLGSLRGIERLSRERGVWYKSDPRRALRST